MVIQQCHINSKNVIVSIITSERDNFDQHTWEENPVLLAWCTLKCKAINLLQRLLYIVITQIRLLIEVLFNCGPWGRLALILGYALCSLLNLLQRLLYIVITKDNEL